MKTHLNGRLIRLHNRSLRGLYCSCGQAAREVSYSVVATVRIRNTSIFRKIHRGRQIGWALTIIGILFVVIGTVQYFHSSSVAQRNVTRAPNDSIGPSSDRPTQTAVANYQVGPTLPKYIAIPSLQLTNSRVRTLGLLHNGAIATPNNIFDAGWYEGSSKPGQRGAMFIYGHVSSWTSDGIFFNLKNLQSGDVVTITRGDNRKYAYRVVSKVIYPYNKVDMRAVLSPIVRGQPGLNLMTCTGRVMTGTSEFNERLVVFATLSNSSGA